jgi:hypothetical protein
MRNNALYFPFINVPNDAWFFRILLYWDKVSSIVPYDFVSNPELFSPHMRDLVTAELVEQVIPEYYIYQIPHFGEAFLEYIGNRIQKRGIIQTERLSNPSLIHIEKMGGIERKLVDLGLAVPADYPWYQVEDWVAEAFMCYLASTLGMMNEINAAPVTNSWRNSHIFRGSKVNKNSFYNNTEMARIRHLLLNNLLPSPIEPFDIDKLISFKLSHGHLMSKLRNTIEGSCAEIANIQNNEARELRIHTLLKEIEDDVETISREMKLRWKRITFGTLIPILSGGASMVVGDTLHSPLAFVVAASSFITAVYQAFDGVHQYNQQMNQPLAYVALTRTTFK